MPADKGTITRGGGKDPYDLKGLTFIIVMLLLILGPAYLVISAEKPEQNAKRAFMANCIAYNREDRCLELYRWRDR